MPKSLHSVLADIAKARIPNAVLVGGSSEFLTEKAFHDLRDAISASVPNLSVETFEPGVELASVLDSYRTMSLFGAPRLLVIPEVNAFVSAKEIAGLLDKALSGWKSSKTDKKRASSAAKLLHVLGLAGADLDMTDRAIAQSLGASLDAPLTDMLAFARSTGKKASRGEDDAAMLMEAIARGGAAKTYLLMRTGEVPADSATVDLIDRHGAVIVCDLSREAFSDALAQAVREMAEEANVQVEPRALAVLRQRLGIERILGDKFNRDIPDLRPVLAEMERLITLAGAGNKVTPDLVAREVATVEGGARYEFGSLFTEGKILESIAKLRDLVAQGRREDPKTAVEFHYGKFLFPLADEVRQMIGILAFARVNRIDLRAPINYNRFKDTLADRLGDFLKTQGLVRQKPHPFPLHKKWEAVRNRNERELFVALAAIADLEIKRKSGGLPVDVGMESFLLAAIR
jgi:hypothetical protein